MRDLKIRLHRLVANALLLREALVFGLRLNIRGASLSHI
jgi:hypothetical protein